MFIELHRTFTEETVLIKTDNILYITDLFYSNSGEIKSKRGAEVCLNGYDYLYDVKGHVCKTRIKFSVIETVEQILTRLAILKPEK